MPTSSYSKLKRLTNVLKESPYLDNSSDRKKLLRKFLSNVNNKLFYLLGKEDYLEGKLDEFIKAFNKEQFILLNNKISFYLEKIFSNFPGGIKNYPKLVNYFYQIQQEYLSKDERNIILFYELFKIVYRNGIFKEYRRKKYFKKFLDNIHCYLNILAGGKSKLNFERKGYFLQNDKYICDISQVADDLETLDLELILVRKIKDDLKK